MKNNTILIVVGGLILTAGSFAGGMKYQETKMPKIGANMMLAGQNRQARPMGTGQRGTMPGAQNGMGQLMGEITAIDEKTITLKMNDGSSKIVFVSENTSINKEAVGTKSDLVVGTKIGVFGQTGTDGSVTAQSVQINPMMRVNAVSPTPAEK